MKFASTYLHWESIAAALASEYDETQGLFFETFAKALRSNCGGNWQAEMQLHGAAKHMTGEQRELFACIAPEQKGATS